MDHSDAGSDAGSSTATPVMKKPRAPFAQSSGGRDGDGGKASAGVDEAKVADFLLRERLYLAALEMHQELLERNHGSHAVAALSEFFKDEARIDAMITAEASTDASISSTLGCMCRSSDVCNFIVQLASVSLLCSAGGPRLAVRQAVCAQLVGKA